jgi:hypothetical protein
MEEIEEIKEKEKEIDIKKGLFPFCIVWTPSKKLK